MIASTSTFEMFSSSHYIALLVIAIISTLTIIIGRRLNATGRTAVCKGIALANLLIFLFEYIRNFLICSPEHLISAELPLHFCALMALLCFIALWWGPQWARSLVYFGVLSASIQGLLTPALVLDFPTTDYFLFFGSHGLLLLSALAIPLLTGWRSRFKDPIRSLLLMNAYLIVIHPINLLCNSNYGFTTAAPAGSILESLHTPAPWYYLWLEIPALALFFLMYLFVKKKTQAER